MYSSALIFRAGQYDEDFHRLARRCSISVTCMSSTVKPFHCARNVSITTFHE